MVLSHGSSESVQKSNDIAVYYRRTKEYSRNFGLVSSVRRGFKDRSPCHYTNTTKIRRCMPLSIDCVCLSVYMSVLKYQSW